MLSSLCHKGQPSSTSGSELSCPLSARQPKDTPPVASRLLESNGRMIHLPPPPMIGGFISKLNRLVSSPGPAFGDYNFRRLPEVAVASGFGERPEVDDDDETIVTYISSCISQQRPGNRRPLQESQQIGRCRGRSNVQHVSWKHLVEPSENFTMVRNEAYLINRFYESILIIRK